MELRKRPFRRFANMLCPYSTEKLIGLEGVTVKNVSDDENCKQIEIEMELRTHHCPCCGTATRTIHDYRRQRVKDIPAFGKYTVLYLRKRRYRCTNCGKRFFEKVGFLPRYHRMTSRLAAYVISRLADVCSFTSVAKDVNLSVSTVIRIFDLVHYSAASLPEVLSIDEFKGNTDREKYQCIITDPVKRRVVDILKSREKHCLTAYFKRFDRSKTAYFVSDMWSTYADISKTFFKNAAFIVDKYHFIRQVIWAFEAVRKEVQHSLSPERRRYFKRSRTLLNRRYEFLSYEQKQQVDVMLYASDKLANAYWLKEQFFRLSDCKDSVNAKKQLVVWIRGASNSGIERYISCANTFVRWSHGILNSFNSSYTNGFTEGCNNKIKVLKRNAYGYRNFNRLRNRILHIFNYDKNEAV
jgi:transposase